MILLDVKPQESPQAKFGNISKCTCRTQTGAPTFK